MPLLFCAATSLLYGCDLCVCVLRPPIHCPFVPLIAVWTLLIRSKTARLSALVFAVVSLLYLWKRLNPPAAQGYFHLAMMCNFVFSVLILAIGILIMIFSIFTSEIPR